MSSGEPTTDKVIINAAITGAVLKKSDTPYLPVSASEIVDCAQRVRDAGAAIVHLHARQDDQSPSYDPEAYREIVERVRELTYLFVCISLPGSFASAAWWVVASFKS